MSDENHSAADLPGLTAPTLLIAMPQVTDPFFARTVILLVHHDSEGSLGYIVNRQTDLKIGDVCEGLGISWTGDPSKVVHFGGPVQMEVGAVLFRAEIPPILTAALRVPPDFVLTANRDDLGKLAAEPPEEFRLMLGYAGWGPGQIDSELLRGDWLTTEPQPDLVFSDDIAALWSRALATLGVSADALPLLGESDETTVN